MTIALDANKVIYTGNGVTTVFPFSFRVDALADLQAYVYDIPTQVMTLLTQGVQYTVAGVPGAGSITYNPAGVPIPSTKKLIILRIVPLLQGLDINNQGGFYPETLEEQLDYIVMGIQQLEEGLSRTLQVDFVTTPPSVEDVMQDIADAEAAAAAAAASAASAAISSAAALAAAAMLSVLVLAATNVPATTLTVPVQGYNVAGDGGKHLRKRVTAQPTWGGIRSLDRYLPNGTIDAGNGGWWDVDETAPNELMFGGVSTNTNAVQTAAIQSMMDYCYGNPGRTAKIIRQHTITAQLNVPAGLNLEMGWGFPSVVFGQGALIKGFNGDMIRLGDGSMLTRPILQGVGGTWTGRGVVIDQGNDQVIHDPFINDMAGPCIEFPTDSQGGRFRCYGGYFLCHTASDPCIVMPAVESITFGYRLFVNPGSGGGTLMAVKNGNMTQIQGGFSAGIDFTGNTTGRVFMSGHRLAASPTITGLQHHISSCSIGAAVTLDASASSVTFTDNIVSGGITVAGTDNNVSSNIITGAAGITLSAGASRNVVAGNAIASLVTTVNNSGNNTNVISDTTYAEQLATSYVGNQTPKANDGAALGTGALSWADLFLASGGVVNWANGDVTVTHSANGLAFGGAANGYTFDQAIKPAANDGAPLGVLGTAWSDLFLASGSVISWGNNVFCTHAAGLLTFTGGTGGYFFDHDVKLSANDVGALGSGALGWSGLYLAATRAIDFGAGDVLVTHSANALAFTLASNGYSFDAVVKPSANDAAALGSATVSWADLFLASGGVLNFNNGNYTVTHAAGQLTFAGKIFASGTIGYSAGAGGTVTQITSRTTGVTLNKASGAITMFSAAGSATAASFTVTNSEVAATDVIILNQRSGTNLYVFIVTAVAAGSFIVTFFTTGGTAVDAPVINYNVMKGVNT